MTYVVYHIRLPQGSTRHVNMAPVVELVQVGISISTDTLQVNGIMHSVGVMWLACWRKLLVDSGRPCIQHRHGFVKRKVRSNGAFHNSIVGRRLIYSIAVDVLRSQMPMPLPKL